MTPIEIINACTAVLKSVDTIHQQWDEVTDEIIHADKICQDILHEIELSNFNACEGYQLAKRLKAARQVRRKAKDTKDMLTFFKQFCEQNKSVTTNLYQTCIRMRKMREEQEKRIYHPRMGGDQNR